ncbi:MAG TPA: glycoside hydrolase family 15 protein [Nitrososphaerales archaeon]|nr:glycoside hydrolase family 15 protein [Nitrososphaerales archaeon]
MTSFRGDFNAFGTPGIPPKWTRGNKDGVGTSYSADSRIWFTVWRGTLTELYYPTVDRPQLRDMEYLVSDESTFFHEEKRVLTTEIERLERRDLGYRITNSDPQGRYRIRKEIISDPHLPCILQHTKFEISDGFSSDLHLYALCAPHLDGGGSGNSGYVANVSGRELFVAEKNGTWLAMCPTVPFKRLSCGYVGTSDGWTDLNENFKMDWEFDTALNGNIALMGEIDYKKNNGEFTLGIALGDSLHSAVTTLLQSLGIPFLDHLTKFLEQWDRPYQRLLDLDRSSGDAGNLYRTSYSVILAHEDKTYPGAMIASMSIPWGESKGDEDKGGYHLVWTRDMVNSASALLAAGNIDTPLRSLIYLSTSQLEDGGFPQNFWIDGQTYWGGIQLDEVAFPIILAWRMHKAKVLQACDPYVGVIRAASFLVRMGPVTQQDRWEEASGYSPSTLATNIAALICAAQFARGRGDDGTGKYLEEYADFLESHIETWTCTTMGSLVPGITNHYIRINPIDVNDPTPNEDPNEGVLTLANQPPGGRHQYPARDIVDPGFLELVRYGIRSPTDKLIVDSLKVVDAVLKVDTPFGPCWHRYNFDGYGQKDDGAPFDGWGRGRLWPLLTAERGHYELAAGNDVRPYIHTMEKFASATAHLPEQVWDSKDLPEAHMRFGRSTGAVKPLVWAHAEYIKLLRSASDLAVFDLIPEVAERYIRSRGDGPQIEIWKHRRQPSSVIPGKVLRVQASEEFRLHWSQDNWTTIIDSDSQATKLGVDYVDIPTSEENDSSIKFTFFWKLSNSWEGKDYEVRVAPSTKQKSQTSD